MLREQALQLDRDDPLASLREQFHLPAGVIYLDGNSLGVLPTATARRVGDAVTEQWGNGLIRSWNTAGWMQLGPAVGDKIARLIGAAPGEIAVADSTSINLFKVLTAAAHLNAASGAGHRVILSERDNFPTDLYIAHSVAEAHGLRLELVDATEIAGRLNDPDSGIAVLMLTQVNYRTGAMHDMAQLTAQAHAAGAVAVWDLAHSAGAVEVDLHEASADFAVGCGYKFLNGGPGAPAFVWAHPRHVESVIQPLSGWMGHAAPFDFTVDYQPAAGINRFVCGTPPVLALTALDCGLDTLLAAEPLGGMRALRSKSVALTDLFIELVQPICEAHGLQVVTTLDSNARGSQVSLSLMNDGYPIIQALIERGVIGDFRAPDILRFGVAPLYVRFVDIFDAATHLAAVLDSGEWRAERFSQRSAVT